MFAPCLPVSLSVRRHIVGIFPQGDNIRCISANFNLLLLEERMGGDFTSTDETRFLGASFWFFWTRQQILNML